MMDTYLEALKKLSSLRQKVAGINPALSKCYPVAIVEGDELQIYDVDRDETNYHFRKSAPSPMPIPKGIRAAFQLEDYGGRIACVVTPDVFNSQEGYVTLLHEFVHCFQYETCEQTIKMQLDIARQAKEAGNLMWEIEYPFPYNATTFIRFYADFLAAIKNEDHEKVKWSRSELKNYLGVHDYEYMVWQEWKEGFARWVENRIQQNLGIPENKGGLKQPYDRVLFYAGGALYIQFLTKSNNALVSDLSGIFNKMIEI